MLNTKNIVLSLAIAIVFMLFAVYGTALFYPEPQFSDFCEKKEFGRPFPLVREQVPEPCEINPEIRTREQQCYTADKTIISRAYDEQGCLIDFECSSCNQDYDAAAEKWRTKAFVTSVILGLIGIVAGALFFKIDAIGSGLMGGGALLIFVFSIRVWRDIGDVVRFVILGLALLVLIYIGTLINRRRKH